MQQQDRKANATRALPVHPTRNRMPKTQGIAVFLKAEGFHGSAGELEEQRKPRSSTAGGQAGNQEWVFSSNTNYKQSSTWVTNPFVLDK